MPYNGTDNNDYVDGQGFCCDDGSPEAAQVRALALENNFQDPDAYEKLQFYYHPDHLGSSSYITNLDGEVVQHIEYVPFGEVFIEERNSIWNTPYLFNAKEFDEETGLYYYGARYYDPRLSLWISTDALKEKTPNVSPYIYTDNNPIIYIDPDGNFRWKALAEASRKWYNLWHKNKASEVIENRDTKNPSLRYSYQVCSYENGEFVVTLHYKVGKEFVNAAQNVGDAAAIAGYALTLSVAGAEVGVPLAGIGNTISGAAGITGMLIDAVNGDWADVLKSGFFVLIDKTTGKLFHKYLPSHDKKIGEEGFDLGTEILDQSRQLKISGAEKITDKVIEEKDSKNNNTKDNK